MPAPTSVPPSAAREDEYDLIVVGSGFGGAMAAEPAVRAGRRVLMIERGDWVARGPHNWRPDACAELSPYFSHEAPFRVADGGYRASLGSFSCVGGTSVFYGGVALRMRERDFEPDADIVDGSGPAWPYTYDDLEPHYTRAEDLLSVAGSTGEDPTEPRRSTPYVQPPAPLAPISARLAAAAHELGCAPFRLPLAIRYAPHSAGDTCVLCGTCDGFACGVRAKRDASTALVLPLLHAGMTLVTGMTAVRVLHEGPRVTGVVAVDRQTRATRHFRATAVALAAGALATPRLLLASGLDALNPAGHAVGRHLMRHCNAVVLGFFTAPPAPRAEFHKQIGLHDYYFGHPSVSRPRGRLGCIQQFGTPPASLIRHHAPAGLGALVSRIVSRLTGFIVMAEDRPQPANRVSLDARAADDELPPASVTHRYHSRDLAARQALVRVARRILRHAGALATHAHEIRSFSHAMGTVRLGLDPTRDPLDAWGEFRGVENLFVTDASALPRSAGVNPSLTIAANALRTGVRLTERL